MSDYRTRKPSDLAVTMALRRVLTSHQQAYATGRITWEQLQRLESAEREVWQAAIGAPEHRGQL